MTLASGKANCILSTIHVCRAHLSCRSCVQSGADGIALELLVSQSVSKWRRFIAADSTAHGSTVFDATLAADMTGALTDDVSTTADAAAYRNSQVSTDLTVYV